MTTPLLDITRQHFNNWSADHGAPVIGTLVLALIAIAVVRAIVPRALRTPVLRQMAARPKADVDRRVQTLSAVIVRTAEIIIVTLALFTVLPEFGFDIRAVLAGVSITSIALGLGAQSLVRDALNGIFILSEDQFATGDIVTVAGVTGAVEDITLRRTVIRDVDGVLYSVPNGSIAVAANYTRDFSKVRVTVPVVPSTDIAKVRAVSDGVGKQLAIDPQWAPLIVDAPKFLRIDNIDMMGVAVQINGTVVPGKQWEVAGVLRARLLEAFQREGIKTPGG